VSYFEALILGIIEGITEFLPISSTGHLIIASDLLNIPPSPFVKAFEVIIQSGAILAVIWHYRQYLFKELLADAIINKSEKALREILYVLVAFLPAAIIGLLFHSKIKIYLFNSSSVALALLVGGLFMLWVEHRKKKKSHCDQMNYKKALAIGFCQCFALWPGMSRSMSTIVGARLLGFSQKRAAEFSFILAIPTIVGASVYDGLKEGKALLENPSAAALLSIGLVSSFFVALIVIRSFLRYLNKGDFKPFAWYRIIFAIVFFVYLTAKSS